MYYFYLTTYFRNQKKSGKIKRVVTSIFIYFRYKKIFHFSIAVNYLYRYIYILY